MLHRLSYIIPVSEQTVPEPSDLPSVIKEDLILMVPVNPSMLFVTWYISYKTHNYLIHTLGEEASNQARLLLRLQLANEDSYQQEEDISGPNHSRYVSLDMTKLDKKGDITIVGQIGFMDKGHNFYAVASCARVAMPRARVLSLESDMTKRLYQRILRRIEPRMNVLAKENPQAINKYWDLLWLGNKFDEQIGRDLSWQESLEQHA